MFEEFKKSTKEDWAAKANADLKGGNVLDTYGWVANGLSLAPYYDRSDIDAVKSATYFQNRLLKDNDPSGEPRVWKNMVTVTVVDAKTANQQALVALMNGADGIEFNMANSNDFDPKVLLHDIQPAFCHLSFVEVSVKQGEQLVFFLGEMPKSHLFHGAIILRNGSLEDALKLMAQSTALPHFRFLEFDHIAATTPVDEIATLLSKANRAIRSMSLRGQNMEKAINTLSLKSEISSEYFGEIAKLRALRFLYFQLVRAYGIESFQPEDLHLHSISGVWVVEQYQPHANMLKSCTAAMAAILGGTNTLIVTPENKNDMMQRRVARNISNILKEESFLSKTADPVAGAYFIESLSDQLAKKSWKAFQKQIATDEA